MGSIQIVVTCSDRKKIASPHRLKLRSIRRTTAAETRARLWIDRLEREDAPSMPAQDLYLGEHWSAVQSLLRKASTEGYSPDLWVCSAGYGLINGNALLKPYSATFAKGQDDSIDLTKGPSTAAPEWWDALASWTGPQPGKARSLKELAETRPRTPLLLVASPSYLRAIAQDAEAAAEILGERFAIVSTGAGRNGRLERFLLSADARLQHRLGGSKIGLNARVASLAIECSRGNFDRDGISRKFKRITASMPAHPTYNRIPLSDEEVIAWIDEALLASPKLTATPALTLFRDAGFACEQKRFGQMFRSRKGALVGD